jgi:hypothetical protein
VRFHFLYFGKLLGNLLFDLLEALLVGLITVSRRLLFTGQMAAIKIAIEHLLFLLVDLQFRLKLHPLCLVRLDKHCAEYAVVIEIFRHGHFWVV